MANDTWTAPGAGLHHRLKGQPRHGRQLPRVTLQRVFCRRHLQPFNQFGGADSPCARHRTLAARLQRIIAWDHGWAVYSAQAP